MTHTVKLHGPHAVKLTISTELKARIQAVADALDRPFAEACRELMWMALPIAEGMQDAHLRGSRWWRQSIGADDKRNPIEDVA
ncbi:MAG: hypothetical protein Kow0074_16370 [Candidatus Zixiibacteriota bacterium]